MCVCVWGGGGVLKLALRDTNPRPQLSSWLKIFLFANTAENDSIKKEI